MDTIEPSPSRNKWHGNYRQFDYEEADVWLQLYQKKLTVWRSKRMKIYSTLLIIKFKTMVIWCIVIIIFLRINKQKMLAICYYYVPICAMHCFKCLMSSHSILQHSYEVGNIIPFYRWGNAGMESSCSLLRVTQQ